MKRSISLILIICMLLGGCGIRARIPAEDTVLAEDRQVQTVEDPGIISAQNESPEPPKEDEPEEPPEEEPEPPKEGIQEEPPKEQPPEPPKEDNRDLPAVEDPESERKEFSSDASGEVSQDAEGLIAADEPPQEPQDPAEEEDSPQEQPLQEVPLPTGEEGDAAAVETEDGADKTITEVATAERAEQLSASDDAPEAETMLQYYNALLDSRLGDLFECKRLDVYMESPEDYVTVFKNSPGHRLILQSGSYDVSAKLLEDDLVITDDWLARKNPGAYIKIVDSSVLGSGVTSDSAAKAIAQSMLQRPGWKDSEAGKTGLVIAVSESLLRTDYGRTAAAVYLAKAMYPSQFSDVDAEESLKSLLKESSGSETNGIYVYVNK